MQKSEVAVVGAGMFCDGVSLNEKLFMRLTYDRTQWACDAEELARRGF